MNENQRQAKIQAREASLRDYKSESHESDAYGFAEHDGDYGNKHLAIAQSAANSNDRMPRIESLRKPENRSYRS